MQEYNHVEHTFGPVYNSRSKILILGSMPSVKSREQQFYYGHPQNRFWKVISSLTEDEKILHSIEEKKAFLQENHIALWDVIESCDIIGSSDSSIKNVKANDMGIILNTADIRAIFVNGGKAYELFLRYCKDYCHEYNNEMPKLIKLPSTSPANAAWSLERLKGEWHSRIKEYL